MRVLIIRRAALAVIVLAISLTVQADPDCSKCDCSHVPIEDPTCAKCCLAQKGTITAVTSTSVTVAPILKAGATKTFELEKNTEIPGQLKEGASATIYYHQTRGQDVATRIVELGFAHGSLVPADLPSPHDTCAETAEQLKMRGILLAPVPADAVRIFLGNSEAYSNEQRLIVLKIDGQEILTLQKAETGMYVSARILDKDGQLDAQIVDNEFFINPRNSFQIKGPGTSSLVVRDDRGEQVFSVDYLNPKAIKILGTFFGPRREEITISENQQVFISEGGAKFVSSGTCFQAKDGLIEMNSNGIQIR